MALVIGTDRRINEVLNQGEQSDLNKLEWLQEQVGGYLECFSFHGPVKFGEKTYHAMMLNEDGKLKRLPVNEIATEIALSGGLRNDVIVGNVVLFATGEID
ncbi:MAG: DUF3846 domain-containing protein [Hafnia sp.]